MARSRKEIKADLEKIQQAMVEHMLAGIMSGLTDVAPNPERDPQGAAEYAVRRVTQIQEDAIFFSTAATNLVGLAEEALEEA